MTEQRYMTHRQKQEDAPANQSLDEIETPVMEKLLQTAQRLGAITITPDKATVRHAEFDAEETLDDDFNTPSPRLGQDDEFAADPVLGDRVMTQDPVRAYLQNVGKTALLTAAQEIELSKIIEAGVYAQHLLDSGEKSSTNATDVELAKIAEQGEAAKSHMASANLRLVLSIARKSRGRGVDYLDLAQEGNLGLLHAIEKFDYMQGNKFSTYASWWIRQSLSRVIASNGNAIRLPTHTGEFVSKVVQARNILQQQSINNPSAEEIAAYLGAPIDNVNNALSYAKPIISLDAQLMDRKGDPGDRGLIDMIADPKASLESTATALATQDMVRMLVGVLDDRSIGIIQRYFGLADGREWDIKEISSYYKLSSVTIRKIIKNGLDKMKSIADDIGLDKYELLR